MEFKMEILQQKYQEWENYIKSKSEDIDACAKFQTNKETKRTESRSNVTSEIQNMKRQSEDFIKDLDDLVERLEKKISSHYEKEENSNSTLHLMLQTTLKRQESILTETLEKINSRLCVLFDKPVVDFTKINAQDCTGLKNVVHNIPSGVYFIYPKQLPAVKVYCDMDTDGGGWTIIQRRSTRNVSFNRTWKEYENGFGDVDTEYWLGLKTVHELTKNFKYELRVDAFRPSEHRALYAIYKAFSIGDADSKYKLTAAAYSGNLGNSLNHNSGGPFSTVDNDNDNESRNLAQEYGPWWYNRGSNIWLNHDTRRNYWSGEIANNFTMMIRNIS